MLAMGARVVSRGEESGSVGGSEVGAFTGRPWGRAKRKTGVEEEARKQSSSRRLVSGPTSVRLARSARNYREVVKCEGDGWGSQIQVG